MSVVIAWRGDAHAAVQAMPAREVFEQTIAAAAPQVGGQAMQAGQTRPNTVGEAITSSSVTTLRNTASGLCAACRRP